MNSIVESSFKLNITIMKIIGFYYLDKNSRFYKIYSYAMYTVCLAPTSLLGFINLFLGEHTDGAFDVVAISATFLSPKLLSVVINSENIRNCIIFLDNEIFLRQSQHHINIVDTCAGICRRNSNIFCFGLMVGFLGFCVKSCFSAHNKLPYDVWVPWSDVPILYDCLYFYLLVGVAYVGLGTATIDTLVAGIICHASGQILVVKENLRYLNEDCFPAVDEKIIKPKLMYKRITECIDHYTAIVTLVQKCERSFSAAIFYQFLHSVFTICTCCLQISKSQNINGDFLLTTNYLVCALIQVYFYCYYGTILVEENNTLTDAIYMSKWYEYNEQSKKALIILMERSKRTLAVTAGKIVDLSLDTFTLILRRSYSLLTVLKTL